jgi:ATP/maltotriose-dependent transcriptional regulator MalT
MDRKIHHPDDPGGQTLSLREIEVLKSASRGRSNREIADALHITEAADKSPFIHIFAELGEDDRDAAVAAVLERKFIRLQSDSPQEEA